MVKEKIMNKCSRFGSKVYSFVKDEVSRVVVKLDEMDEMGDRIVNKSNDGNDININILIIQMQMQFN